MIRLLLLLALASATQARAHESRPLAILVEETGAGRYALSWRAPASIDAANAPSVALDAPCAQIAGTRAGDRFRGGALYDCGAPLAQSSIVIDWPLYNPSVASLCRVVRRSGETTTALLGPEVTRWRMPAPATFGGVAKSYFRLGVAHILVGADHILFLAGLLVLARTPGRILVTATGFTLAHSATLALVALDAVDVSVAAVEATIALSIVFVAAEIARGDKTTLAWRRPLLIAASFGLLHGAGFASALGETGLPQTEKVPALLFFNLGVEAGQLVLVAAALVGARVLGKAIRARVHPLVLEKALAYGAGGVAALWFVRRIAGILPA